MALYICQLHTRMNEMSCIRKYHIRIEFLSEFHGRDPGRNCAVVAIMIADFRKVHFLCSSRLNGIKTEFSAIFLYTLRQTNRIYILELTTSAVSYLPPLLMPSCIPIYNVVQASMVFGVV